MSSVPFVRMPGSEHCGEGGSGFLQHQPRCIDSLFECFRKRFASLDRADIEEKLALVPLVQPAIEQTPGVPGGITAAIADEDRSGHGSLRARVQAGS